jgi:ankyrin repeat protein
MQEKWLLADRHSKTSSSLDMPLPAELASEIEKKLHSEADLNEELFDAVRNGNTSKARTLLNKGADINAKLKGRGTLLHGAALNGQKDLVELLLSKGADVNAKDDEYGATPLHLAAYNGHKEVVRILLAKGVDINTKDKEGDTPLDNALASGHRDVAELIKDYAGKKQPPSAGSSRVIQDDDPQRPVDEQESEPDFITGLWHGLTSPLRLFGLFDLHYEKKENWSGSYALGLVIGCLVILYIGIKGLFKGKKQKT